MNSFLHNIVSFSILCLTILFFPGIFYGQTSIKGIVSDADTGLPLPYVNIGFVERGLGTVSEENGTFNFYFDSSTLSATDTLKVSYLAYKDFKLPFSEVAVNGSNPMEIKLDPDILSLDEIVLTDSKRKRRDKSKKMVGYSYVGQLKNGSWEGDGALGGELITKINVSKKERQLNAFYFYVLENKSDSLLVRVNIYDGKTKEPERRLTNKNIVYTIKTKVGKVGIDLTPYNIIAQDDFCIGIELLKVYGDKLGLVVAGDDTPGVSYRRYASQGEWKRYSKDALTYFVSTTILEETEDEDGVDEIMVTDYSSDQLLQSLKPKEITQIGGFVFLDGNPITNAQILNLTSGESALTNEAGRYSIKANVDDELEFSYGSLQKQTRKVLEISFAINVSLEERVIELDEAVVTAQQNKKRTQKELFEHYNEDPGIIKTSFGIFDKTTSGVSMKILDESDIRKSGATTLGNLLRGKVSGLSMLSFDNLDGTTQIGLRQNGTQNPIPAVYEIDGMISSGFPSFLDITQIKRIAVLSGLSAVAKYGSVGAGGVIIINTNLGNFSPSNTLADNRTSSAIKAETINAITEEEARQNWPDFLQELYDSPSLEEAQDIYTTYEPKYGTNPNFSIDAGIYFFEYWPEESFTQELISVILDRFNNDFNYKKGLAFVMDKYGKYDQSVQLYKQLLLFQSNSAESYRDLANAYVISGQKEKGKNLYARYFNLLKEGYFPEQQEALRQVINTEVKTLLEINEEQTNSPLANFIDDNETRTRILLEWNDDSADLDFQFVDPRNTLSNWSNANDGATGESLISKGYTSKDFFIYGDDGPWKINVLYRGNQSGLATYLKITISSDYGTTDQKDNIKIFRMDIKNVNRALMKI